MSETTSVRILQLVIHKTLGCDHITLSFPPTQSVHLLLYSLSANFKLPPEILSTTPIVHAIQLLCTLAYPNARSLEKVPSLKIGEGFVRMRFQVTPKTTGQAETLESSEDELDMTPSTSAQAALRQAERQRRREKRMKLKEQPVQTVVVTRRFENPLSLSNVIYKVDKGAWKTIPIDQFHAKYFVSPGYSNQLFYEMHKKCSGNWLRIIKADDSMMKYFQDDNNPFALLAKLFEYKAYTPEDFIIKLGYNVLRVNRVTEFSERYYVIQVFDQVRTMFEFITMNQYTVWFFVPHLNRFAPINFVTVEDFDLTNVRTSIKRMQDPHFYYWHQSDHNIQDILLVAFQLALACLANQSVVILTNLEKLSEFICWQYVTAFFMNQRRQNNDVEWVCFKYLDRIIQLAETFGLLVFIEYPGSLTMLPPSYPIYKCKQNENAETGEISWSVYSDITVIEFNMELSDDLDDEDPPPM